MFHATEERSPFKYNIYISMVRLAGQADLLHYINPQFDEVKKLQQDPVLMDLYYQVYKQCRTLHLASCHVFSFIFDILELLIILSSQFETTTLKFEVKDKLAPAYLAIL